MFGVSRIAAAFDEEDAVFSNSPLVPRNSPYFSAYLASKLKKIKQERDLYKTVEIDSRNKQFVNFGLRAATLAVLRETKRFPNAVTTLITIQLTEEYFNYLKDVDSSSGLKEHPPVSQIRELLRRKLFDKFGIKHEYFVVELGSNKKTIHVHIVCSLQCTELKSVTPGSFDTTDTFKRLKKAIRSMCQVANYHTAVQIKTEYRREFYTSVIGQEYVDSIEMDIEGLGAKSGWQKGKTFTDKSTGEISIISYKTKGLHIIDSFIADYLSKSLTDKIFSKSRYNFSISLAVRKDLKAIAKKVIDRNRSV